jgi:glyoxylase-like metal-dependent hydrolase (beta-lactamase superfamily II)
MTRTLGRGALAASLALAIAPLPIAPSAAAQRAARPDSLANARGRAYVAGAIDALGGVERLRRVTAVSIHGRGTDNRSAQVQGPAPDRRASTPHEEWLTIDRAHDRAALEYHTPRNDGSDRWRRFAYEGSDRTVLDLVRRRVFRRSFPAAERVRRDLARRVPHLLLLEAGEQGDALRALGDTVVGGRAHHVVAYPVPGRETTLRLLIDAAARRLTALSYALDYPGIGDAVVDVTFAPYAPHAQLGQFPTGHTLSVAGVPLQEVRYAEVVTDTAGVAAAFRVPEDLAAQLVAPGTVEQVAPGVFVVHALAGFTALFVEFRDYVLAAEAPAQSYVEMGEIPADQLPPSDSVAEALIERIRRTVPNKPIRYVAVSHFHNDHAGGVRAFFAEGATLLTTPGTRPYFERLARARATVAPDRLSRLGERPMVRIETVADRRVITDGERTVEVINAGPNPHTDEALVVYLPREGILYQGDQFYFDDAETFPPRDRLGVMRHFAGWLARSGLRVERIYGTHMTGYATMAHVRQVLDARPDSTTSRCTSGGEC